MSAPTTGTFSQLRVGQSFRVRHDGRGEVEGGGRAVAGALAWSDEVYTKIRRGVCKDAEGQWLDVAPTAVVQVVQPTTGQGTQGTRVAGGA